MTETEKNMAHIEPAEGNFRAGAIAADNDPSKKRGAPEPVPAVSYRGTRFEALQWGKSRGLGQNGGYIAAYDIKTNKELHILKIYDVRYDEDMEEDKQDVFITTLRIKGWFRKYLFIQNERGERYSVNLRNKQVTRLK